MDNKKVFVGLFPKDKTLKAKLQAIADAEDRSMSWVLEKFLSEGVKHHKSSPRKKAA